MLKSTLLKIISYVAALLIILSFTFLTFIFLKGSNNIWKKTGLKIFGQNNVKMVETSTKVLNKHRYIYALGSFDGKYIKINRIQESTPKESELYVINESIRLESLFQKRIMPYPGLISFTEEADPKLWPVQGSVVVENKPVEYYLFYADEQFRPCLHVVDKIKYRSIMFFLYNNKNGDMYKIEFYVPNKALSSDEEIIKIIDKIRFD